MSVGFHLICFRTGHGHCLANLYKWGMATSDLCACGQQQTMNHTVNLCPLRKLEDGLQPLHDAGDEAVYWLVHVVTTAFTTRKNA